MAGPALAAELGISLRTLYRDIATLQGQGAAIDGAPGLGYVLQPGFTLPPLMFDADEVEALVLGSRWVAGRADARLAGAARQALAKIGAVLPEERRRELENAALIIGPSAPLSASVIDESLLREAIRTEHKLAIDYRDAQGRGTRRVIWPIALGFFDRVRVVVAWCELRRGLRHFRTDRIAALELTGQRYERRRPVLLREWQAEQRIASAADRN